jgi:hypothetical protein
MKLGAGLLKVLRLGGMRIPQLLHKLANDYTQYSKIMAHFAKFYDHSRTDRLSDAEIEMWSTHVPNWNNIKERRELFQSTPLNKRLSHKPRLGGFAILKLGVLIFGLQPIEHQVNHG